MEHGPLLRQLIEAQRAKDQVDLFTPAHHGQGDDVGPLSYADDVLFLTRARTAEAEARVSALYDTEHTFLLTNGGSQGVLTICTLIGMRGRRVAIALNSHMSTVSGLVLAGLEPVFIRSAELMPTTDEVIACLEESGPSALLLTHPAYDGTTLDLARVAAACRRCGAIFAVDEAHGGHLPFVGACGQSALAHGADVVSHSMHKYAGSLVQTALLHLPRGSRFRPDEVAQALALYEPSTRSNLLLVSLEEAIHRGFSGVVAEQHRAVVRRCDALRTQLDRSPNLGYLVGVTDPLKLMLRSPNASGTTLVSLLNAHNIDVEYEDASGALLIFSFQHGPDVFERVAHALEAIDRQLAGRPAVAPEPAASLVRRPAMAMLPREAFFARRMVRRLADAEGRVSAMTVKRVPPGQPVLIPGEVVTRWHVERLPAELELHCVDT